MEPLKHQEYPETAANPHIGQRPTLDVSHAPRSIPAIKTFPNKLYVITVISNPARYRSRYRLYRIFEDQVRDAGAFLYTVEMAFGGRHFEVTEPTDPFDIQVRGHDELWHKENLINIGLNRLPPEAEYVAWIDADVQFAREDWAQETMQQLQHYDFVQMFSHAQDLGPNYEPLNTSLSWTESRKRGLKFHGAKHEFPYSNSKNSSCHSQHSGGGRIKGAWHSGLAWAARRSSLDKVGGLIDTAILGSADRNMAAGLHGHMEDTIINGFTKEYNNHLLNWQRRAERHIRRNVGQVDGLVTHAWHGKKVQRFYTERWKILVENKFNPQTDIKKDSQGLWRLEDDGSKRFMKLRDDLRRYFRARNEDSIDIE